MPVPLACTLSPADRLARAALISALTADALISRRATPGGLRFILRDAPGVERRVLDLIALERRCCPFLALELVRTSTGLELAITGPPEAAPVIEAFFA